MGEALAVRDAYRGTGMGNAHTGMQCQRIDEAGIRRSGGCGGDHSKQKPDCVGRKQAVTCFHST